MYFDLKNLKNNYYLKTTPEFNRCHYLLISYLKIFIIFNNYVPL
jgi:hypothetical protein